MARLTWSAVGERIFEAGVDRGVLFIDDQPGIPWMGLISVAQRLTGFEAQPYYIDGVKYLTLYTDEEFEATIEAYTYPDEFLECEGTEMIADGFYVDQQDRKPFNLVYRTKIGNDVDGTDHGHKIHFVYNALAAPSERSYQTMNESSEASTFSWDLTTTSIPVPGKKPTAHFVIDSRKVRPENLAYIEDLLYGIGGSYPEESRLPTIDELIFLIMNDVPVPDMDFWNAGSPSEFSPYTIMYSSGGPGDIANLTVDTAVDMSVDGGTPTSTYTWGINGENPYSHQIYTFDRGIQENPNPSSIFTTYTEFYDAKGPSEARTTTLDGGPVTGLEGSTFTEIDTEILDGETPSSTTTSTVDGGVI